MKNSTEEWIGAKIITKKYLDDKKINFSNILFLHSKKDKKKREQYFSPFIKNKKTIKFDLLSSCGVI